ncbi:MAG TPA: glycoside hydrolase family 9 protein [Gemmatimonadaceae bacterium]|nr:glycoside hydrolase family 9 protein [Gemmatimonadaceae bacterium]
MSARAARALPALALLASATGAQQVQGAADRIRLDQVGYLPTAPKLAVVVDSTATRFAVLRVAGGDTAFSGALSAPGRWAPSGETVRRADFGALRRPGRYRLVVPGVGVSHPFEIADTVFTPVARAAIKAFYFQRASTALDAAHAGRWARPAGHPDDSVVVHPSAASAKRPAGTVLSSPRGWYDAGDYNKYIVNSGISTWLLLALDEHFPDYARALRTDVPESGDALPDVVDEALWNVRWMLTMQDPGDGGVYHKLTHAEFDAMQMPHRSVATRWVVQKSTAAALDFAAVMATAARTARRYPQALPALADSLVAAATAAWRWAEAHPDSLYDQRRLNAAHRPAINTGEYGDRRVDDERRWAAAELYLTTRDAVYLPVAATIATQPARVPGWPQVGALGLYSLLQHRASLPPSLDASALEARLLTLAGSLVARRRASPYEVTLADSDFVWGSNAVAADQGIALLQAYRITRDTAYLHGALAQLDYLLGRNATGYSFVTGIGAKPPRLPHHRPSAGDTVAAPVPGLLVGGPNPRQQDRCPGYPSTLPARSYVDATCSYAANEIAINWNAPLAYLAGAIDALRR